MRTWIERVPTSALNRKLTAWKAMRNDGWDVTVLVDQRGQTTVMLALPLKHRS